MCQPVTVSECAQAEAPACNGSCASGATCQQVAGTNSYMCLLQRISHRFYCRHDDQFEFLTLFSSFPQGDFAFYQPVKNRIRGIGPACAAETTVFDRANPFANSFCDDSESYGSGDERLEGIVNMKSINQWPSDPRATDPRLRGALFSTLDVLGQEVGHRWGT